MISVDFKMFVDRKAVMKRIDKQSRKVLGATGAYVRTAMKRSIRPPKAGKKSRTVVVDGRPVLVPVRGKVIDVRTGNPVSTSTANKARLAMAARLKSEGAGQPPRRGPTDLLRKFMFFGVDGSDSVVIGPMVFKKQPDIQGADNVPELLNQGGSVIEAGMLVNIPAHPFIEPLMPLAQKKFAEEIEKQKLV